MTMGILGKVVFYQSLDAAVQLFPNEIKVLLRGMIPSLHEGADVLLYDYVGEVVWKLSSSGTDKFEVKTERAGEDETLAYKFALFMTSSTNMAILESLGS
jgi:hypothetical protein